jgi:outer membrane protein
LGVSSDQLQSNYSLGLSYSLNSATLLAPQAAKANRAAADADITGASELLRSTVTQQYITALQAADNASLQDTLVETARGQLELAKARVAVGAATILDTRRAEVTLGQAEVAALTAHNSAAVEKLRLFQQIGINAPDSVVLSTKFAVARPSFSLDSVLDLARRVNPAVHALRERERASGWNVRMQQSQYTPTLSVFTGWGGNSFQYTNFDPILRQDSIGTMLSLASCLGSDSIRTRVALPSVASSCYSRFSLTSADMQAARDQNRAFPFRFTRAPFSLSAQVSIPVFDNFSREQRIEQAQVDRDNARFSVRAQELQLTGDVTQDYLNLVTAERTVELQDVNAQAAREELAFAEERYRVGAATFLDVTTSHGTFAQAQVDRLKAIYDYHRAFAALESAVGRPLR